MSHQVSQSNHQQALMTYNSCYMLQLVDCIRKGLGTTSRFDHFSYHFDKQLHRIRKFLFRLGDNILLFMLFWTKTVIFQKNLVLVVLVKMKPQTLVHTSYTGCQSIRWWTQIASWKCMGKHRCWTIRTYQTKIGICNKIPLIANKHNDKHHHQGCKAQKGR